MDHAGILAALQKGTFSLQGQFVSGSNYTFLGTIEAQEEQFPVVYKPLRGEQPLWDFPLRSLAHREVAAYLLSQALGWELVPPTVFRRKGPLGSGSVQFFINHDPEYHYFNFSPEDRERLRPVAVFDLITNNADRKGGHILKGEDGHLWMIDHGLCFHSEDKLRTVVWDFAGQPVPAELLADLARLDELLAEGASLREDLLAHILEAEVAALALRAQNLRQAGVFPPPPESRRHFPWPPV
ncbi:MAG: SCO1664 family protein [Anaerolineaceae bacterium]|nr:SCO1664 family protein [Anaerolineaceae bacterium]